MVYVIECRSRDDFVKLKSLLERLKDFPKDIKQSIENQDEYIKMELDVRVESINAQLNRLSFKLKKKLDKKISCIKRLVKTYTKLGGKHLYYEKERCIEGNNLRFIKKLETILKLFQTKNVFTMSKMHINESSMIGSLISEQQLESKNDILLQTIQADTDRVSSLNLKAQAYDCCVLNNGSILFACGDCLIVYSNKEMQTINQINSENIFTISLTTNRRNGELFIADNVRHRILKLDSSFNFLQQCSDYKTSKSQDDSKIKFNSPNCVCFANSHLYVCDLWNERIVKLNENLKLIYSFKLNFLPWYIKIYDRMACIRALCTKSLYFYELNSFTIKHVYNGHNGIIGQINLHFYEFNADDFKIYVYDKYGLLKTSLSVVSNELKHFKNRNGAILEHESKLFVCSSSSNTIAFF